MQRVLTDAGHDVVCLDLRAHVGEDRGDVRDAARVTKAVASCDGILHLAAVSRVIWAEQDPELCRATNLGGTRNVVQAALTVKHRPWVVFASSREVYGESEVLPVTEDAPLRPINVYGETKVAAEDLLGEARAAGLGTAIVRLSNVYGSVDDHVDRVVPAFARQAIAGERLRIDGTGHTFDFTHVDDTARGIAAIVAALVAGEQALPPIHLLTGTPTTLGELARAAVDMASSTSGIEEAPPRRYDVARFHGDPRRARTLLGWEPRVSVHTGLARLIADLRRVEALP